MSTGRENNGRFAAGNKLGRNGGRPGYGVEYKSRKIFNEVFDEATFRAACMQLKAHIFGQKVNIKTQAIEADLDSTPASRLNAWEKMASYKLGKPIQPVLVGEDTDGELMDMIKGMAEVIQQENDEEKLQDIVNEAKQYLSKTAVNDE